MMYLREDKETFGRPVYMIYLREDVVQWAHSLSINYFAVFCICGQVTCLSTYIEQSDQRIFENVLGIWFIWVFHLWVLHHHPA